MATGDYVSSTTRTDGNIDLVLEGDVSTIDHVDPAKTCDLAYTAEGYSSADPPVLGTVAITDRLEVVAVSFSTNTTVTLRPARMGYSNDDATPTITADANCFLNSSDVAVTTAAISGQAVTVATGEPDYPKVKCRIAGVIQGGTFKDRNEVLDDAFDVEVVAFQNFVKGAQPCAAVKVEISDVVGGGSTTVTKYATAMQRSAYDPTRYTAGLVAQNLAASDPFAAQGGGSGVFVCSFTQAELDSLTDGFITIAATGYPRHKGDADSLQTDTWTHYNDAGGVMGSDVIYYVDTRGSAPCSGGSGTFTEGEWVTDNAGTYANVGIFRYESGGSVYVSWYKGSLPSSGTLTGERSGATRSIDGAWSWNGDDSRSTAQAQVNSTPWRSCAKANNQAAVATTANIERAYLMGDANAPTYYDLGGRTGPTSTGAARATYWYITPDPAAGGDIVGMTTDGESAASDIRAKLICWHGFDAIWNTDGKSTVDNRTIGVSSANTTSEFLFKDCTFFHPDGHTAGGTASGGTIIRGDYPAWVGVRNCLFREMRTEMALNWQYARDVYGYDFESDIMKDCPGLTMEICCGTNPQFGADHQDGYQLSNKQAFTNVVVYNTVWFDLDTPQGFICNQVGGWAMTNSIFAFATYSVGAYSQIGEPTGAHTMTDVLLCYVNSTNGRVLWRSYAASTQRNNCIAYSVGQFVNSIDGTSAGSYRCDGWHNANLDSVTRDSGYTVGYSNKDPWVNGAGPQEDDTGSNRDFRPNDADLLVVPAADRFIPFDPFFAARSSSDDGWVGTLVAAAPTVSSVSPSSAATGTTLDLTVTGTGFIDGIAASSTDAGFTVNSETWVSATEVTVNVTGVTAGTYTNDLVLTNPDGQTATGTVEVTAGGKDPKYAIARNAGLGIAPRRIYPL